MTYEELVDRARKCQSKILRTVTGKEFTVGVYLDCPYFTPASTGLGRSDGSAAAQRFLERFNRTGSLKLADYQDVTRNASYFLALAQEDILGA